MRQTLIYGIIALILVVLAAGIAFFFTSPNQNSQQEDSGNGGFFGSLFPFGNNTGGEPLFEDETPLTETDRPAPRLREVSATPVSGGYLFERNGDSFIRFIDRATGHLFETKADTTTVKRITNTTVPGIQEVLWSNENEFIIRYLEDEEIQTFFVSLDPESTEEQSLSGGFIDSYIQGSIDSSGENVFAAYETTDGSEFIISEPDGTGTRNVFSSPIRSWIPLQSDSDLFLQTAPSAGISGFLYQVVGGALTKITGPFPGLTTKVSPSGRYVLVSASVGSTISLARIDTLEEENSLSPVGTLSDKCIFMENTNSSRVYCGVPNNIPNASYPNAWLLGEVSFSDSIWEISFDDSSADLLTDLENETGESIDVWQPSISPDGEYFLFINKNDLSLWSLNLP